MRRTTTALLAATAALALLAGCGTDTADDPNNAGATSSPSQEPTSETPPEPEPSSEPTSEEPGDGSSDDGPPFPSDTASQTADPQGDWDLVLTAVRVGDHDGYDRVVMEFAGTSTPGWSLGYVADPVQDGSGDPIDLDGDAFLDIYASGTTYPMEGDPTYDGPSQFAPEDGGSMVDVKVGGTFEGYTQLTVGLTGAERPFRVFPLADPPRLVVDVAD